MDQVEKYRKLILNKKIRVMVFVWLLIFVGFFIYIFQVNSIATKGFTITKIEREIKSLNDENKKLTIELSGAKDLAKIESFSKEKNMVKIDSIDSVQYVNLFSNVAMNK